MSTATSRRRSAVRPVAIEPSAPPWSGEVYELKGNGLVVVDDDSVWFVERGTVDLYSMPVSYGAPAGLRHHLLRVAQGGIFLGVGLGKVFTGRCLVASGSDGVRVVRAPRAALAEGLRRPETAKRTQELVERWIGDLHDALGTREPAGESVGIESGQELSFTGRGPVRTAGGVLWVLHLEGRSSLRGDPDLIVSDGGYFPLAPRGWLQAEEGATLYAARTEDLTSVEAVADGLARLGRLVWTHAERALEDRQRADAARAQTAAAGDQAMLEAAVARLAAAAYPGEVLSPRPGGAEPGSELLACCRLVGAALGVAVQEPPHSERTEAQRDPLAAILRASRLRARQVALREDWWRHDHGALLGARGEGAQPVALLRRGRRYVCVGPDGAGRTVDAAVAGGLAPFAHTFYAPLPDGKLGVRDVLRFAARGCRGDVVTVLLMALVVSVMGMIPPAATGVLFNAIIPGAHRSQLQQLTVMLIVCAISGMTFGLVRSLALMRIDQRMGTAVQAAVWDRLLRLPLTFFRPYTAGDLATRAMAIEGIHRTLSGTVVGAIVGGIFSLSNLVMMFMYSPTMALRGLGLIALAIAVTALASVLELGPQREAIKIQAKTSGLVLQLLTSIAKLRVAGAEARAFSQWAQLFGEQRRLGLKIRRIGNGVSTFGAAFPMLAQLVIFWAAIPLLGIAASGSTAAPGASGGGGLRAGDFLAFSGAFASCLGSLLATSSALIGALSVIPLYEQAQPILETRPEVQEGLSDPGVLTGAIELQGASFRYQEDAPLVLHDVSLRIRPGEFVALVGPSGSGKSTLLRLLLGFEKLEAGGIYYDGLDLTSLDVQAVRRQIGVVLQNGSLVPGDIFTNISAAHKCSLDEAWAAAAMAGIADDIRAMPMQMHTVISEGASTLSGGQRQRLMIARAIVNRPRLLFFDEATSALDNRTQALVTASLDQMKATRVVVAHRLSTIINADRIVVIDRGRIVETGTYAQLLAAGNLFADLARRQLL